jgi:hypothetical protein
MIFESYHDPHAESAAADSAEKSYREVEVDSFCFNSHRIPSRINNPER